MLAAMGVGIGAQLLGSALGGIMGGSGGQSNSGVLEQLQAMQQLGQSAAMPMFNGEHASRPLQLGT